MGKQSQGDKIASFVVASILANLFTCGLAAGLNFSVPVTFILTCAFAASYVWGQD